TFGSPGQRGDRGGFGGGRGGLGAIGPNRGKVGVSNLNVGGHYRRSNNTNENPFPSLGGTSDVTAWDVPVGYAFPNRGILPAIRFGFNRQDGSTQNRFEFDENIAGQAGLLGVSSDPFDWGAPGLSFSTISSLRDLNPSTRTDRTLSIGDSSVK